VIEATLDNHNNKQDGKGTTVFDKDLSTQSQQLVTRDFLKKYISFIKSQKAPELTDDSLGYTSGLYATLRKKAANFDQNKISQPVTVRTLETIIRLSTAHAKLRFSKTVEISDIDVAITLMKQAIFQEHLDKKEPAPEDEEMNEDKPLNERPTNKRQRPVDLEPAVEEPVPQKKMRIDPDAQVTQLFSAKPSASQSSVDMLQKKLIFKIVNTLKDGQNKCTLDQVWKRYMGMNERETLRKGTNEPLVNNKDELILIVEALERDNLVMYAAEESHIILM